ncbi:MAG: dimethylargininase [Planctomycetota bacterium]|jgi:dimethylargininase
MSTARSSHAEPTSDSAGGALLRRPGPELASCVLSHVDRTPIDLGLAQKQHAALCAQLERLGLAVRVLDPLVGFADACFVEDPALVLPEVAIIGRLGTASREAEAAALEPLLGELRPLLHIEAPNTLEGGDVLRMDDTLLTGLSGRTNHGGMRQLAHLVLEHGYRVKAAEVEGALHLKTAVTWLGGDTLLANRRWVNLERLEGMRVIEVHPEEPFGANVLKVGEQLLASSAYPRTIERMQLTGFDVKPVDISEFHKAEAGLTCLTQLV